MKRLIFFSSLIIILLWTAVLPTNAQVNVTQEHNNLSRDGLYIDSAFTPSNAANLTRDTNFSGTIVGNVHAQPLYIEGYHKPSARDTRDEPVFDALQDLMSNGRTSRLHRALVRDKKIAAFADSLRRLLVK